MEDQKAEAVAVLEASLNHGSISAWRWSDDEVIIRDNEGRWAMPVSQSDVLRLYAVAK